MGRHRREYPQGRLRLKYPKQNYDAYKYYTLYYEYTWLTEAPIRKFENTANCIGCNSTLTDEYHHLT